MIYLFLPLLFLTSAASSGQQVNPPNIVLIYADDLGKGMLSLEGQEIIATPHIDEIGQNGIRFDHAYSSMLCAPSRASLISGKHDCHDPGFEVSRAGTYKEISSGKLTYEEIEEMVDRSFRPISENDVFLGEAMQKAGYTTAQYGKLGWGFATNDNRMKRQGWDHYFGYFDHIRAHGFYPPFLFSNGRKIDIKGNTQADCGKSSEPETEAAFEERWDMTGKAQYSQDLFMDSIRGFISEHKDRPFFLYFPTQLPHGPVSIPVVHEEFKNDDRLTQIEKEYASMVKRLDSDVGQIVQMLKDNDLYHNTMVIFASDNGHEIYYAQEGRTLKPYTNMETGKVFDNLENKYYSELSGDVFNGNDGRAGMKRSNLQGGIEVPLYIQWPGTIKAGSRSDRLVALYDVLETLADLVEVDGGNNDGSSFLPTLLDPDDLKGEHEYVVFSSFEGPTLITRNGWKIRTYLSRDVFELYYLPDDYREKNNLADTYPEKLSELKKLLLESCDDAFENGWYRPKDQIPIR